MGGTEPLRFDEMFVQFADGLVLLPMDDDTHAVFSMGLSRDTLYLLDGTAPTSSDDPTGEPGDVVFSGDKMYRRTEAGWIFFQGRRF
jgi:hypothetical protein